METSIAHYVHRMSMLGRSCRIGRFSDAVSPQHNEVPITESTHCCLRAISCSNIKSRITAESVGEVVLLTASQAEFTNRWDESPQISCPDNHIRGSPGAIEGRTGYALLEGRKICQGVIDTEQSSHPLIAS
jgi:hypothetical protein